MGLIEGNGSDNLDGGKKVDDAFTELMSLMMNGKEIIYPINCEEFKIRYGISEGDLICLSNAMGGESLALQYLKGKNNCPIALNLGNFYRPEF